MSRLQNWQKNGTIARISLCCVLEYPVYKSIRIEKVIHHKEELDETLDFTVGFSDIVAHDAIDNGIRSG
jgi:hypothetical protein